MEEIEGVISIRPFLGSDVLVINDMPLSKYFIDHNGNQAELSIRCGSKISYSFKGIIDIFYFEGKQDYFRGIKYVNDFLIDDIDIIELLEKHENEYAVIKMTSL